VSFAGDHFHYFHAQSLTGLFFTPHPLG
jgi:hypothetical protein